MIRQHGFRARRIRATLIVAAILLALTAAMPALLLVPKSGETGTTGAERSIPAGADGVFLMASDGYRSLYGWNMPMTVAPDDAVTVPRGETYALVVSGKRHFSEGDYALFALETGQAVRWEQSELSDTRVTLLPGPLPDGAYMLRAPTSGFFGGETYHYFVVENASGTP